MLKGSKRNMLKRSKKSTEEKVIHHERAIEKIPKGFSHSFLAKVFLKHLKMSLLNRVPCVPMFQKRAIISFLCANVPKTCHFSNWRARRANFSTISKNFSIMANICKFQEYLDNCRKFISRNKEFKF